MHFGRGTFTELYRADCEARRTDNGMGCFCASGVGDLYRIHGVMKKEQYNLILEEQMIPSAERLFGETDYIFQQDNDPKHKANLNMKWLEGNVNSVLTWPPQSPDLNPIENLWSILDFNLRFRKPRDTTELFDMLRKGWNEPQERELTELVASMPSRLAVTCEFLKVTQLISKTGTLA